MQLAQNPFLILGVSTRDGRRRIVEVAEQKILAHEEKDVREARALLTTPKKRLAAELAWLPGVGPKRIRSLFGILNDDPTQIRAQNGLPALAKANLLADGLRRSVERLSFDDVVSWIIELAMVHEQLDATDTVSLVNEEREVAGFPTVSDVSEVKHGLLERRRYYGRAIKDSLNSMQLPQRVKAVTQVAEQTTKHGTTHAPVLIDDVVDMFEVSIQGLIEKETAKVKELCEQIKAAAALPANVADMERLVTLLEHRVKIWDAAAQPMQVSARSRGLRHDLSHTVASELRSLGITLFNEYDMLEMSQRLTTLQRRVFDEVDALAEQSKEDASILSEFAAERERYVSAIRAEADSWRKEITYEAVLGFLITSKLRISPEGVQWKAKHLKLSDVTRLRWGGTRQSINGISQGVQFRIFVGGLSCELDIKLKDETIYREVIERLWKATGVRLLTELLQALRLGQRIAFGKAVVYNEGVELERDRWFIANERVACRWSDVTFGTRSGFFFISKADEPRVRVALSYQDDDNVHVLEQALQLFMENDGSRLSDLLNDD